MRILLICEAFQSLGGVQESVDNLARQFIAASHAVAIVSSRGSGAPRTPASNADYFELKLPSRKPLTWRHPERLFRRPETDELTECLRRWRPELVNSHAWDWDKIPVLLEVCRAAGVPMVQTLYDLWGEGRLGARPLAALAQAAAVVALSQATKDALSSRAAVVSGARVIRGGVDCAAADTAAAERTRRPFIFCAARLDLRHKALDRLIEAYAMVATTAHTRAGDFPIDLRIAGDGPDRGRLRQLIEAHHLSERVHLLGAVTREHLWRLHKAALFFAMASYMPEGLGLGFLEAMACGKAVIGSRVGGTPEIVQGGVSGLLDGVSGLLVEGAGAAELADAMRRLLSDEALRQRMGRAGCEAARAYDWAVVAEQYLRVYDSALRPAG